MSVVSPSGLMRVVNAHLAEPSLAVPIMCMHLFYLASTDSADFGVWGKSVIVMPISALVLSLLRIPFMVMTHRKVRKFLLANPSSVEELEHLLPGFWRKFIWLFPGPSAVVSAIYATAFFLLLPHSAKVGTGAALPYMLGAITNGTLCYWTIFIAKAARAMQGAMRDNPDGLGSSAVASIFEFQRAIGSPTADSEAVCCICLEELADGDSATKLVCMHIFHTACIKRWMEAGDECPMRCSSARWSRRSSAFQVTAVVPTEPLREGPVLVSV